MGVSITEVKDHMEYWLTKRTSEIQTTYEERLSTVKVFHSSQILRLLHDCTSFCSVKVELFAGRARGV